ncbi:L,D-transpeptidase family protein [Geminicoccaceae bacterium 1502E]|nr:L,D-transpeptidase family protein [Geminicoccaceae bacterium 1502E]
MSDISTTRRHLLRLAAGLPLLGLPRLAAADLPVPPSRPLPRGDRLVVFKRDRRMELQRGGEVLRSFRIALGFQPAGPKLREGDGRTPEGSYRLDQFRAESAFYRAIRISYPAPEDRQRAAAMGVRPGGQIMIHGLDPALREWGSEHWMFNWTNGCIAVTNQEMDILWASVAPGTPIEIYP